MIGDVLTSTIIFEALRKQYPEAELHYLIYKHTKPVVEQNPFIDRLHLFDPKKDVFLGLLEYTSKLRKEKFDVVIDAYSKINSAFITLRTSAKTKIGYKKWYTNTAYDHCLVRRKEPVSNAGLAIENRLLLLEPLGFIPELNKPRIFLTSEEIESTRAMLLKEGVDLNKPVYMIAILGSSETKTYPPAYMAKLLDFISENSDGTLLFNYIPSQSEQVEEILFQTSTETKKRSRKDIFGKSLREFLAICAQCTALIGNEGGAVNMAKALNIPTFAIFSPHIRKESWSTFEDGNDNVAVHLNDFKPEIYKRKPAKEMKKDKNFYLKFKPELFKPLLLNYLKNHS